ncbi:MAG: aspartyl protease family protein [Candidatus Acidiferrales bacterium]
MIVAIGRFTRRLAAALAILSAVCLVRAQSPRPGSPPAPAASNGPSLQDAQHLYRSGKFDAAIQEYSQLESGPQAALAYAGITSVYLARKDPQDAYASAGKAMDLAPKSPEAQVAIGEALFRQGKIPEAETAFVAVINSGAQNARAYYGLARVSQTITYFRRMKTMIDKAHELDPNDRDITRMWMSTLTLGERIRALHEYLAQETDDAEGRMAMERQLVSLQDTPTIPAHQCRITSQIQSTTTDLRPLLDSPTRLRGYGLDVKFNGTTGHLLLDTGAAGILIGQKLAEKAGVQHVVESSVKGIGDKGSAGAYVGHVDKIQVGDIEFQDCNVQVIDQNSVINSDGLIGAVEFSHFLVELDMPNRKMRLSQLPARPNEEPTQTSLGSVQAPAKTPRFYDRYVAPEMENYTRIFRIDHMLLIPTEMNRSVGKLFLIDTGSPMNMVAPEAAREVTKVGSDPSIRVKGISGEVKDVYSADKLTLAFANLRQENQDMISVDMKNMSDGAGTEISGTLGFTVLRMLDIKIDYRDALVWFGYNWKHPF